MVANGFGYDLLPLFAALGTASLTGRDVLAIFDLIKCRKFQGSSKAALNLTVYLLYVK